MLVRDIHFSVHLANVGGSDAPAFLPFLQERGYLDIKTGRLESGFGQPGLRFFCLLYLSFPFFRHL